MPHQDVLEKLFTVYPHKSLSEKELIDSIDSDSDRIKKTIKYYKEKKYIKADNKIEITVSGIDRLYEIRENNIHTNTQYVIKWVTAAIVLTGFVEAIRLLNINGIFANIINIVIPIEEILLFVSLLAFIYIFYKLGKNKIQSISNKMKSNIKKIKSKIKKII